MRAMYTAATGMDAQTIRIDTIANNLANADTTGFKSSQVDFADLMYLAARRPGAVQTEGSMMPTGLEIGTGVTPVSTLKIFTPGSISNTAGELDLAITGPGFFQVETPTGEVKYTRDGNFRVSHDGTIVNSLGYPLSPQVSVPSDALSVAIGSDGTVTAELAGGTTSQIGTLQLARFTNPAGLSSDGGNLYAETIASGPVVLGTPAQDGYGEVKQGYLETSNVELVKELVDLIMAQRTYELNSKVVRAGDRVLSATNYLVS